MTITQDSPPQDQTPDPNILQTTEESEVPPDGSPSEDDVDYRAQYLLEKQKAALAERELENLRKQNTSTPKPVETDEDDEPWDWSNPKAAIRRAVKGVVDEAVAPFREQTRKSETQEAYSQIRQELPGFSKIEDHVKFVMKQAGIDPETVTSPDLLRTFYYTTKGYLAEQGVTEEPKPKPTPRDENKKMPVQHRPSSTPMPTTTTKPAEIELTEAEDTVRRANKMSKEDWVKYRDMDPADVIKQEESNNG